MDPSTQETRKRLIDCARKEFLAQGFEKASLRHICAQAGLTTGAVYFFFQNKEDLFSQIVEDTARQMARLGQRLADEELREPTSGVDSDLELMKFLFQNKDEVLLLLEKSQGTHYAAFPEELYGQLEKTFLVFFRRYGNPDTDPELIRILVKMRMEGFLELLKGDYPMEYLMELTRQIGIYADGGFRRLTDSMNSIDPRC